MSISTNEHFFTKSVLKEMSSPENDFSLVRIRVCSSAGGIVTCISDKQRPVSYKKLASVRDLTSKVHPDIDEQLNPIESNAMRALRRLSDASEVTGYAWLSFRQWMDLTSVRTSRIFQNAPWLLHFQTYGSPSMSSGLSAIFVRSPDIGPFVNLSKPDIMGNGPFVVKGSRKAADYFALTSLTAADHRGFVGLYTFQGERASDDVFFRTVLNVNWRKVKMLLRHSLVEGPQEIVVRIEDEYIYRSWLESFRRPRMAYSSHRSNSGPVPSVVESHVYSPFHHGSQKSIFSPKPCLSETPQRAAHILVDNFPHDRAEPTSSSSTEDQAGIAQLLHPYRRLFIRESAARSLGIAAYTRA